MSTGVVSNEQEFQTYPGIPFQTNLSLLPLIRKFRDGARSGGLSGRMDRMLLDEIQSHPKLESETLSREDLATHGDLIQSLLARNFPLFSAAGELTAVIPPFGIEPIFASEGFTSLEPSRFESGVDGVTDPMLIKILAGFMGIASKFYNLDLALPTHLPFILKCDDGTHIHYRVTVDQTFMDIQLRGELPHVSSEDLATLKRNGNDPELWKKIIPLESFRFSGLVILHAVDVTRENLIASIQKQLLAPGSLLQAEAFAGIQRDLRSLIGIDDLEPGVASYQNGNLILLGHDDEKMDQARNHFQCARTRYGSLDNWRAVQVIESNRPVVIDHFTEGMVENEMERELHQSGVRSLMLVPLYEGNRAVGGIMLKSLTPNALDVTVLLTLQPLIPYFALAVVRSVEELDTRVQMEIRRAYTAIHPSVEWRFQEAAMAKLGIRGNPEAARISFQGVFPLYAQTDIQGSTSHRNDAIQEDLIEELDLVSEILREAYRVKPMIILDHLGYRVESLRRTLDDGVHAGEEEAILRLLKNEVEPALPELSEISERTAALVEEYGRRMDPSMGMIYDSRRKFDRSVSLLNQEFSDSLEEEQSRIQAFLPHYFEKNTTDGIDFGVYAGPALQPDGHWNQLYMRNLRIWHLLMLCKNQWIAQEVSPGLPIPLEVTHLAVVQNLPLSIYYSTDARQFEVEGAYNIRYEIMKKRIDKAKVKNTDDRITKAGYLTVVFSQLQEGQEYLDYLKYLISRHCLEDSLEELDVEDLQGIRGLRAFRAPIARERSSLLLNSSPAQLGADFEGFQG